MLISMYYLNFIKILLAYGLIFMDSDMLGDPHYVDAIESFCNMFARPKSSIFKNYKSSSLD